jgi:hypothetical protein
MVQLVKLVRIPPSKAVAVGVIVLVGGDGGSVSRSIDSGGNLSPRETTIDGGARGCRSSRWRR